ncbi:MAG: polysaccharide biosynthesis protein [Pseudomonadota bacterium]
MQDQQTGSNASRPTRVLITGGSGSVGVSFMESYPDDVEYHSVSRNAEAPLPSCRAHAADIRDGDALTRVFLDVRPDIVVHAAAMKHVNQAELQPSQAVEINILGTLNVIKACLAAQVPVAVAISTDKACQPENMYGYTKRITEQIWLEHHCAQTRFVCARFANVAASAGSVIPIWLRAALSGETLKLTDSRMNRLMFSAQQASALVRAAADHAAAVDAPFVLVRKMKSVNMLQLANAISADFGDGRAPETIGLRPGERLNETLVSDAELEFAFEAEDGKHIMLHSDALGSQRLKRELSSLTAEYMTEEEIRLLYLAYAESLRAKDIVSVRRGTG